MLNPMTSPYQYPQQQLNNGIKWVQGIEGAKAYQMTPNSNTVLMDSDNDGIFYIKVSDNIGMCTLRVFEYKELQTTNTQHAQLDMSNYVTKDEINEIVNRLVKEKMDEKSTVQTTKSSGKLIT